MRWSRTEPFESDVARYISSSYRFPPDVAFVLAECLAVKTKNANNRKWQQNPSETALEFPGCSFQERKGECTFEFLRMLSRGACKLEGRAWRSMIVTMWFLECEDCCWICFIWKQVKGKHRCVITDRCKAIGMTENDLLPEDSKLAAALCPRQGTNNCHTGSAQDTHTQR